ncbi:MAG TPA: D-2-hydroxyacid dehydrogenase [Alphaproteobacteria bacterium]|nr:D-2-hydroxyacid dehydrogenase [Alphaproteobacteria bacterium]
MTRLLILLTLPEPVRLKYLNRIRASFPALEVTLVDHASKLEPLIPEADILVTFGPMLIDRAGAIFAAAKNLKWVQALGTGVDNIADIPTLRPDVIVTNLRGLHGSAVSEAAIAAMLALGRDIPRSVRAQERHAWERWPTRLLDGKTAGILGVGAIAEALAPRLKALGMKVVGISSGPRALAGFDEIVPRASLIDAVRAIDHLVLLTPYSPETHHLVDARVLAAMKPSAYLVNLARGGVVDEAALIEALEGGRLAGAALDVFANEPLPPDHPFWQMKSVLVTAHLGGFYDGYPDQAIPIVEENIRRFLAGEVERMVNRIAR